MSLRVLLDKVPDCDHQDGYYRPGCSSCVKAAVLAELARNERTVTVFAEPLAQLLAEVDPGGFRSNALGVRYVDDGNGIAARIDGLLPTPLEVEQ